MPINTAHDNPLLDSRVYVVQYHEGHKATITANQIAENLLAQVDKVVHQFVLLDKIIDHRSDETAVSLSKAIFVTSWGTQSRW